MKFEMDTPKNIDDMTMAEIAEHVVNLHPDLCPTARKINIIRSLAKAAGLQMDKRMILGLSSQPQVVLLNACPGAGKTTMTNLKAYALKHYHRSRVNSARLTDGNHILFLVYNDKNVGSTAERHAAMGSRLNSRLASSVADKAQRSEVVKDTKLNVTTMHSFCKQWLTKYTVESGLVGLNLLDDNSSSTLMLKCTSTILKKYQVDDAEYLSKDYSIKLKTLYNLQRECMIPDDRMEHIPSFVDLGLDKEIVLSIFEIYDKMKTGRRAYDFTDMIVKFYEMIRDKEYIRNSISLCYDFVIADETQDFTPIMFHILRLLVDTGLELMCLCDEDQTIYDFRGASVNNILNFRQLFPECKIYDLSVNRRCRKAIYDESLKVIGLNNLRFNKEIRYVKEGGSVEYLPYTTERGQLNSLLAELKKMSYEELSTTAVGYRNHEQALALMEMLQKEDIPFHMNSGVSIFETELYNHVFGILDLLVAPFDQANHLHLYKLLPIQKTELYEIIGYNEKNRSFKQFQLIHFSKYEYGKFMSRKGFANAMQTLEWLSANIRKVSAREVIGQVFRLFNMYFWNFRKQTLKQGDVLTMIERDIVETLDSDLPYSELSQTIHSKIDKYKGFNKKGIGLEVSTFHKMKGLQYNTVYLLYLDESIFPNNDRIEHMNLSLEEIEAAKESEVRLYYVAMTRAIDRLVIYYNKNNPSSLITRIRSEVQAMETEQRFDVLEALATQSVQDTPVPAVAPVEVDGVLIEDEDEDEMESFDTSVNVEEFKIAPEPVKETKPTSNLTLEDQISLAEQPCNKSKQLIRLLDDF